MSYNKSWEAFKDILLLWVNGLRLEQKNITMQDLSGGKIFKHIICEVCKANVDPSSNENTVIESFLEIEYPEIILPSNAEKRDLLMGALLIHFWSIRLAKGEHRRRDQVWRLLGQEAEETIHQFLKKLLSFDTVQLTLDQLTKSIESLMPTTVDVLPAAPGAQASTRSQGPLAKFLNGPVLKQHKLLVESQRKVRQLTSELDQEQLEKGLLEEKLATRTNETRKLESQLKSAHSDIAKLEEEVLQLQESASSKDLTKQLKSCKQEIKSLNATIKELELSQHPLDDRNAKLEARCAKLEEALQLSRNNVNDQEILLAELSQAIQSKDQLLESLASENKELTEYVKGIQNGGNDSTDFETSVSSFLQLPGSPLRVVDTVPLSVTVVDKLLVEKKAELTELEALIETALEKVKDIFLTCNSDCPSDRDLLANLEMLNNLLKQQRVNLIENSVKIQSLSQEISELKDTKVSLEEIRLSQESQNSKLKEEIAEIESICNKLVLRLTNVLQLTSGAEVSFSKELSGSPRICGFMKLEGLVSHVENQCKKYQSRITEMKLSELQTEQMWNNEMLQLKEELTSCVEREKLKIEECQSLKSEMDSLQLRYTELSTEREGLSNELFQLKQELTSCEEREKLKIEEFQSLKSEMDSLQLRYTELSTECDGLSNELFQLKQELTSCEEREKLKIEECQSLKSEMNALQLRYTELLTELANKTRSCLDWSSVGNEISKFQELVDTRIESLDSNTKELNGKLSDIRSTFDRLNSWELVDKANLKNVESLKFDISNTLSRLEEKFNCASLGVLNCIYSSLNYPSLVILRQVRRINGEDPAYLNIDRHFEDVPAQIAQAESQLEKIPTEIQEVLTKVEKLEGLLGVEPADASFLDDSLEVEAGSSQMKDREPPVPRASRFSNPADPNSVTIRSVVETVADLHARQFRAQATLRNKIHSLEMGNESAMTATLKNNELLTEQINEQQNKTTQLQKSYDLLLLDCELALRKSENFKRLLAHQEKETQNKQQRAERLEEHARRLEHQLRASFTEDQVELKVEGLGVEYNEKLEGMKAKMRDLFRKELAKFQSKVDDLEEKLVDKKKENAYFSQKVARLEVELGAWRDTEHADLLLARRESVMGHLQRQTESRSVLHAQTSTSTTFESADGGSRRHTITTQRASLDNIPSASFAAEDEEGEVFNNTYQGDLKAGRVNLPSTSTDAERLEELQFRNSLCPPHLKSSYPAETQFHDPQSFRDEEVKGGELLAPRAALREVNGGARPKISTPNRIRQLFYTRPRRDENSPKTPRGDLFRKSARGREDC